MTEDNGCLSTIVMLILAPFLSFGIGWIGGWFIEVLFLGEPYMTPVGFDMKVLIGLLLGGLAVAKYFIIALGFLFAALMDLA